jgi:Spherulation-specific family 4
LTRIKHKIYAGDFMSVKRICSLLALGLALGACTNQPPINPNLKALSRARSESGIGVISYWGTDQNLYNQLPDGSMALVNPENGIFAGQTTTLSANLGAFQSIVKEQDARGVEMLGYVPTGYFNHTCDIGGKCQTWSRIEAQVQAYFENMPNLGGIFFDEAAPSNWDCNAFIAEYEQLREIVNTYNPEATIAFNAGVPDNCIVNATDAGEIAVLFESDQTSYEAQAQNIINATSLAQTKGVLTWHLIHSVKTADDMLRVVEEAKNRGADYAYVTSIGGNWQAGENTWGSLPPYWEQEITLFSGETETE